ncbi:MAG: AraC family transcriptional regulator [Ramlibacter sp.]
MDTGPVSSSVAWVKGLFRMFESQGVAPSRLLAAAGIEPDRIDLPNARLNLQEVNRLWELAVAASGQETLGLDRVLAARHIDLEIGANWAGSGASLWSVLESQARYAALAGDASAFTLEREHPDAWVQLTHGNDPAFPRQRIEYSLLAVLLVCQRTTRSALRPLAAEFVFPEPADVHAHRMAFACPLRFDRPANRLLFAQDDLALPVVSGSPSIPVLEERVLESLLQAFGSARTSFRVAQELVRRLRQAEDPRASLARSVGLAEAVLARQLRAERRTVDDLLDRVRKELAHEYLAGSDAPIAGIPALLGLGSEAEFSACTTRWFGQAPADYRIQHGLDAPPR